MLEAFTYENHKGVAFEGLPNGVYLQTNELRDYSWEYETMNNRISRFYRATKQRKIPLLICCKTVEEAAETKNRLLDLADIDIEAIRPGKIRIGEWYTTGYITSSKKKDYRISGRFCGIELVLTSTDPCWYREQVYVFGGDIDLNLPPADDTVYQSEYPYDYHSPTRWSSFNFDYFVPYTSRYIRCSDVRKSQFRIRIFGEVDRPVITIGSHVYALIDKIEPRAIVDIDSRNKTIVMTDEYGGKHNWFYYRDPDSYIFEPVPTGIVPVSYNGQFRFELTVIEERSEPAWT